MKNAIQYTLIFIVALAFVAALIFGMRAFTTATVRLQVERATPSVMCAKIVTSDGAALSCWKESAE